MVLDLSDLEPVGCNNGQDETELKRNKKAKKNNPEREVDSSISSDHSCFVALVTASNLHKDALDLPKEFASSNLLEKECRKIVLRDRWERSWAMDLAFNKSSDTFNIRQGWRSFCDENGKKAGSFFVFKLIGNRETPLLSLCSTESTSNKNNTESCVEHSTTPPIKSRLMTLTIEHASFRKGSLRLPLRFMKKHGLDKPRLITLLGKDGTKWVANLRRESSGGRMRLGKGWKDFALDNGLKVGDSFTFELVGKNNTPPMLSLIRTKSTSDTRQPSSGNKTREGKKTIEERRDSSSAMKNQLVTLTLTPEDVRACQLILPSQFMKANGIYKLGKITLLGKNGTRWLAFYFLLSKDGLLALGCGWKDFCQANGVKTGESFTLECICEANDATHVFKFCSNSGVKTKKKVG
ncbi:PREDICTED: LOW QUALITY PROTEIN: B3 domain-containing protein REM12 [Brassica oleracea var. oleracea]|uniref:LOW QUALITY PROTEIN: B3 domain-containing protein REM12 n=1 Tax=Brassica oleracea var. oleracea TaxID=109376 RepID=UPI0006A70522|nr:PREDICTED: LOW QUALITY PROTEIN: B3 domain-containing protein REM12 [Brassica oleracea var. oleracea]